MEREKLINDPRFASSSDRVRNEDTLDAIIAAWTQTRTKTQVMEHSKHGPFKMPAWPVRIDGKPPRVAPSPMLGEHTVEVLADWLGPSEADFDKLHRDSVV